MRLRKLRRRERLRIDRSTRNAWVVVPLLAVTILSVSGCIGGLLNRPPNAQIAIIGPVVGPVPFEIHLDISQSHDPDGEIISFELSFGDTSPPVTGTDPALVQSVSHTYTARGSYVVSLTVIDNDGKQGSKMIGGFVALEPSDDG